MTAHPRDRRKKPYVLCARCGGKHPSVGCPKLREARTTTTIGVTHA